MNLAKDLHADIKNGQCSLQTLKTFLAGVDRQRRTQILDCRVDNNTLVTLSCEMNRLDLVQYFITECDMDVNAPQEFQDFSEACSMLCWACKRVKQDFIVLILQNGADINFSCKSGKGPLHYVFSASTENQKTGESISKLIKLLMDRGATVDGKTCYGATPLMFACGRHDAAEACVELISRGADVSAVDDWGDPPLHYQFNSDQGCINVEILKILLESGADVDQQNKNNQTPLDIFIEEWCGDVAMTRYFSMPENHMQILLDRIALKNKYHMLEICGAMFALNREDVGYAIRLWRQAHLLISEFPHLECCRSPDGNILYDIPACERSEQSGYMKLTDTDRAGVLKQAVIKSYRHLEFRNNLTFMLCGDLLDFYIRKNCYDEGLDFFTKLLDFITEDEKQTKLFVTNCDSMELLMDRFVSYWFSILKYLRCSQYDYSLKLISILLTFLEKLEEVGLNKQLDPTYGYRVIDFLEHFTKSDLEMPKEARKALQTCIQYNMTFSRGSQKGNLFHLACLRYSESKLSTLQILLQNGMTANAVDEDGNTALHTRLLRRRQTDGDPLNEDKLLNFLINNTHMHIPNNEGVTPLDLLARHTTIHPLDYITLKCLAARVISHHKIHYVDILPKPLQTFMAMH